MHGSRQGQRVRCYCVQVYRLITCGTVEEKIYRKQCALSSRTWLCCPRPTSQQDLCRVFKGALSRSGTSAGVATRYFSQQVHAASTKLSNCLQRMQKVCLQPNMDLILKQLVVQELTELFRLDDSELRASATQAQLAKLVPGQRADSAQLAGQTASLRVLPGVTGARSTSAQAAAHGVIRQLQQ